MQRNDGNEYLKKTTKEQLVTAKNTRKEVRNSSCFACNSLAAFCRKTLLGARSGADEYISNFLKLIPNIDNHEPPKIDKHKRNPNIDNKKL